MIPIHKNTIMLSLALVAFVVASVFLVQRPIEESYRDVSIEFQNLSAKIERYGLKFRRVNEILQRRNSLSSKRSLLLSTLYSCQEAMKLVENIDSRATRLNLNIGEISPSVNELLQIGNTLPGDSTPHFLNISVGMTGGFKEAGIFLEEIQEENWFWNLNSIHIRAREEGKVPAEYALSFKAILGPVGIKNE
ncbi:MAG: hypothetical protein IIB00_06600 [candidate division Zixibacteria bacterium]|nr:hypothetical protein [candidate division Zixibacteria bacterium]